MSQRFRPRFTYANVVSTLCLFILLGGSSYAAVQLSKGQVKTKHIAKNAVTSAKVKDGSLLSKDFKAGQLPAGAKGDPGPKGDPGANGAIADNAVTNTKIADNAVTDAKIADNAVTNTKIADDAVTNTKIADDAVTNTKIANGSVTATKMGARTLRNVTQTIAAGTTALVTASCGANETMLSGGGVWNIGVTATNATNLHLVHSFPASVNSWGVRAWNGTASAASFSTYVVCLQT
jgi:hypothetical protein